MLECKKRLLNQGSNDCWPTGKWKKADIDRVEIVNRRPELNADTVIVLDFETTGLSSNQGDRPIEIGAVRIEAGHITDSFQKLMNPGFPVDSFIEGYTGITNQMLAGAPGCEEVMEEFAEFIGETNLVAHNASFDQRFLDSELELIGKSYGGKFACSMLVSRRVYQAAPNHRLESLVRYKNLQSDGVFHRALADSQMTAHLWLKIIQDLRDDFDLTSIPFALMRKLSRVPKAKFRTFMTEQLAAAAC